MEARLAEHPARTLAHHGQSFHIMDTPLVAHAAAEFSGGFEEGTLQLFDAALPLCDRMIDFGAYIGFTTLYAAGLVSTVDAFEPSPTNFALLARNVALNPALAPRIALHHHAIGDRDDEVTLYGKGLADSGSSLFQDVERGSVLHGRPEALVPMRDAGIVLREIGIGPRSLLKIDIEGAEYQVIPAIADLLARARPFLHISFHPFNITRGADEYKTTIARLRHALDVAEAVASYRHMYVHGEEGWVRIDANSRLALLRQYLLRPKPVPRIATAQYGFTDSVALSDVELPSLCP